jgi:cysteinyl-tRNA synthetase
VQASDRLYYLYQTLSDISAELQSSEQGRAALASAAARSAAAGGSSGEVSSGGGIFSEAVSALSDDLNTAAAVAALSAPLKAANDYLTTKKGKKAPERWAALAEIRGGLAAVMGLLGLSADAPEQMLEELKQLALTRYACVCVGGGGGGVCMCLGVCAMQ